MNISNKNDHANHPATSGGARDRPEDAFGSASDPLSAMRSSESQKLSLQTDECSPECLAANARQVSRLITRHFDRALKPHGLSSGQLSLLTAIETGCAQSVSELAASLSLDRTTLVRNLALVEKKGLGSHRRQLRCPWEGVLLDLKVCRGLGAGALSMGIGRAGLARPSWL